VLERGKEPERELTRPRDLLPVGQLRRDGLRDLVGHARLVEVPQVPQQRHVSHGRDHGLPRL
jgi:hypothetical protein